MTGSTPSTPDLVYDVGMHRGEDTAFYLALGYRVVAFEANPELAKECRRRFADALNAGRLTMVEGAIADTPDRRVTFYVDANSQWGSIDSTWVRKKQIPRAQEPIMVPAVDLADCMERYGVPHYLKADIEGADRLCLEALRDSPGVPQFLSIEAEQFDFDALLRELDLLEQLGYSRFAVVRQDQREDREVAARSLCGDTIAYRFSPASSGPFGDDLGGAWGSRRQTLRRHRRAFRRRRWLVGIGVTLRKHPIWLRHPGLWQRFVGYYDTHARL